MFIISRVGQVIKRSLLDPGGLTFKSRAGQIGHSVAKDCIKRRDGAWA